jgi:hypothetical protein
LEEWQQEQVSEGLVLPVQVSQEQATQALQKGLRALVQVIPPPELLALVPLAVPVELPEEQEPGCQTDRR